MLSVPVPAFFLYPAEEEEEGKKVCALLDEPPLSPKTIPTIVKRCVALLLHRAPCVGFLLCACCTLLQQLLKLDFSSAQNLPLFQIITGRRILLSPQNQSRESLLAHPVCTRTRCGFGS